MQAATCRRLLGRLTTWAVTSMRPAISWANLSSPWQGPMATKTASASRDRQIRPRRIANRGPKLGESLFVRAIDLLRCPQVGNVEGGVRNPLNGTRHTGLLEQFTAVPVSNGQIVAYLRRPTQ